MSKSITIRRKKPGWTVGGQAGQMPFVFNHNELTFSLDDVEYEVTDNRKYVQVQILTRPGQAIFPKSILTYEDTVGTLKAGDYVTVPVGTKECVGVVVEYGRGGWDGYVRAVIGRLSLDRVTVPF